MLLFRKEQDYLEVYVMGYMMFPGEAKKFFENDYLSLSDSEKRAAQLEADIIFQKNIFQNQFSDKSKIDFDAEMRSDEIYICAHEMVNDKNFKQKIIQQFSPVAKGTVDRKSYIAGIAMSRYLSDYANYKNYEKQNNSNLSKIEFLKSNTGGR